MSLSDVLMMTRDAGAIAAVQSALMSRPFGRAPSVCGNMMELRSRLSKPSTNGDLDLAMVDIDHDPDGTLLDLAKVTAAHPRTRFMVLSTDCSEGLILQTMQAGVRYFLRKESITLELDGILKHLLSYEPPAASRLGDVISVFSCSGGCGATTVAINLANELRLASSEPVLLVDMDHYYGSVAAHLGLSGNYGIAHVLNREGAVDGHLIKTGAVGVVEGFDVLLSPAAAVADASLPMKWENTARAVEACRESYRYVVIDAPRVPAPAAADLAALSQIAVVVFQLTVRDVSFAKTTIANLSSRGMARDRILPLANRVRRRAPLLQLREGRRAIGMPAFCSIRSDWRRAVKSVDQGQPLAQTAHRSRLRRDFRRLALEVHKRLSSGNSLNNEGYEGA
jgi:pilus assembly protein CpaE